MAKNYYVKNVKFLRFIGVKLAKTVYFSAKTEVFEIGYLTKIGTKRV